MGWIQSETDAVICWGWGSTGEGHMVPPAEVDGTAGTAHAIAIGDVHGCAIQNGTRGVVCWGGDDDCRVRLPLRWRSRRVGEGDRSWRRALDGDRGTGAPRSARGTDECQRDTRQGSVEAGFPALGEVLGD